MYAIIEHNGKQYKVVPGQTVSIEKIAQETGAEVVFDKVLMIQKEEQTLLGNSYISGAKVLASVEKTGRADKVIVFKQRPRKVYRKRIVHRQPYTSLKINEIILEA
jgi:large subunit ribosomal protein L21